MRLLVEDVICDRERVTIRTIIPADKVGEDAVLCTPIRGGRAGQSTTARAGSPTRGGTTSPT